MEPSPDLTLARIRKQAARAGAMAASASRDDLEMWLASRRRTAAHAERSQSRQMSSTPALPPNAQSICYSAAQAQSVSHSTMSFEHLPASRPFPNQEGGWRSHQLMRPSSSVGRLALAPAATASRRHCASSPEKLATRAVAARLKEFQETPHTIYPELRVQISPPPGTGLPLGRSTPSLSSRSYRWEAFALSASMEDALNKARSAGRRATSESLSVLDAALESLAGLISVSCTEHGELLRRIRQIHSHYLVALMRRVTELEEELERCMEEVESHRLRKKADRWMEEEDETDAARRAGWETASTKVGELYLRSQLQKAEMQVSMLAGSSTIEAMREACECDKTIWQQLFPSISLERRLDAINELHAMLPNDRAGDVMLRLTKALHGEARERFLAEVYTACTTEEIRGLVELGMRALHKAPRDGSEEGGGDVGLNHRDANEQLLGSIFWMWGEERLLNLQKLIAKLSTGERAQLLAEVAPELQSKPPSYQPPPLRFMPHTVSQKVMFGSANALNGATRAPVRSWGSNGSRL